MESLEPELKNDEKSFASASESDKVTPPVSLSSDISDVQITGSSTKDPDKVYSIQSADKKAKKTPSKPRAPRRKPSDPPVKPRSRAKAPAKTAPLPAVLPPNPSPVFQTVFTTGQRMMNSLPVNFLQQAQVNVNQLQAASLSGLMANSPRPLNRVLLPKPSSGQKQLMSLAQNVQNIPQSTTVTNVNGQTSVNGQNGQTNNQHVVSVQQTSQADAKQGTALNSQSAQSVVTNGPQQTFVLNGPSVNPNHMMALPQSQIRTSVTSSAPGTVQVRLQTIQTTNGPMTLAFFGDQPASFPHQMNNQTIVNNQQQINFVRPPQQQQFQVQKSQQQPQGHFLTNGFQQNVQGNVQFNNRQSVQQLQQQAQPLQTSFLSSAPNVVSVSQVAQAAQQPSLSFSTQPVHQQPQPHSEKSAEPEFNLDEFLTFPSTNTSSSTTTNIASEANQLLNDLQSILGGSSDSVKADINSQNRNEEPKSSEKKRRPKKDNTVVKRKVEEILKTYAEEKSRNVDTSNLLQSSESFSLPPSNGSSTITTGYHSGLPQQQLLPSTFQYQPQPQPKIESVPDMVSVASLASSTPVPPTPPQPSNKRPASSTTASKKVKKEVPPVPTPSPPKPIPPPPSKPARKKTDLAERMKKDVKTLEKLDMRTAFKGMINSANKLMPFHLLDESEENPDIAEREETAFIHVAEGLLERESQLYCRYMDQLLVEASNPVPVLDTLSCLSTWLDSEREEFEAEKAMAAEGLDVRPPLWVYSDFRLESKVPFYNGRFLEGFPDEPTPVLTPEPPLPVETKAEPPKPTTSVLRPEAGRLKLVIKRSAQVSPAPPQNLPKKNLKLKLKMSANKWVVGGKSNETGQAEAGEDLMRSAVDSILQFGSDENGPLKNGPLPQPLGEMFRGGKGTVLVDQGSSSAQQPVISVNGGRLSSSSVFASEEYNLYNSIVSINSLSSVSGNAYESSEPDSALDEAVNSILG